MAVHRVVLGSLRHRHVRVKDIGRDIRAEGRREPVCEVVHSIGQELSSEPIDVLTAIDRSRIRYR